MRLGRSHADKSPYTYGMKEKHLDEYYAKREGQERKERGRERL